jgi:hypothetical protein
MQREAIKAKEDSVEASFKGNSINYPLMKRTAQLMDKYSHSFPDDTLSPYFLYRAGEMFETIHMEDDAIKKFNDIRVRFPNSRYAGFAIFAIASVYDDIYHNKSKAVEFYKMYIDKYPGTKLASDAQKLIDNINIPMDSLIKIFEKRDQHIKDSIQKSSKSGAKTGAAKT